MLKLGLKGNIVKFVENFLSDRKFVVNIKNCFSNEIQMENGIPQGSVLSVTLFQILINSIVKVMPQSIKFALYCDDLVVFTPFKRINTAKTKIQKTIENIETWSNNIGLYFSHEKTKGMIFSRKYSESTTCNIKLNRNNIEFVTSHNFLGLIFDRKLNWKDHIEYTCAKAVKKMNLLKILTRKNYHCDRKTLLRLLNVIIIPVLDYSSIIFSNANKTLLSKLNTVLNTGIRLCTGAYRTSPIDSLLIESGQLNFNLRNTIAILKYGVKILSWNNHPLKEKIQDDTAYNSLKNRSLNYQPLFVRIKSNLLKYNIHTNCEFDKTKFQESPPWLNCNADVNTSLDKFKKSETNQQQFQSSYNQIISTKYLAYKKIFSDGSVDDEKSGCAIKCQEFSENWRLTNHTSICTAELYAIMKGVEYSIENEGNFFLICSDSYSALLIIKQIYPVHPIAIQIKHLLSSTDKIIKFLWIPGHMGIGENNDADKLAKDSLHKEIDDNFKLYFKDLNNLIKKAVKKEIQEVWLSTPISNKLRRIKSNTNYCQQIDYLPRKEGIVISRLRIGHTKLTHSYIFEKVPAPTCICQNILSIEHIFDNCHFYRRSLNKFNIGGSSDLVSDDKLKIKNILEFLKENDLFHKI
jgi:ribonuclease HI